MGSVYGPNMVTDDLIFMLDAGNVKSYPGSGTAWDDLVGSVVGTLSGGPSFSSGNGGYIAFDGTNDKYSSTAVVMNPVQVYTIHLWFRVDHTNAYEPLYTQFKNNYRIGVPHVDMGTSGQIRWSEFRKNSNISNNTHYWYTGSVVTVNVWQCVTVVRLNTGVDNSEGKIYFNGQEISLTYTYGGYGTSNTVETTIGGGNLNTNADMDIAMVLVYNKALTAAEVLQNYNAHKSRFGL